MNKISTLNIKKCSACGQDHNDIEMATTTDDELKDTCC